MSILNGKKVIIIGDRDGIPGEAIKGRHSWRSYQSLR